MNFIVEADSVVVVYFLFVFWIQRCTASLVPSIHRPAAQPGILSFTVYVTPFLPVGGPIPLLSVAVAAHNNSVVRFKPSLPMVRCFCFNVSPRACCFKHVPILSFLHQAPLLVVHWLKLYRATLRPVQSVYSFFLRACSYCVLKFNWRRRFRVPSFL